jgi:hypothetical protein
MKYRIEWNEDGVLRECETENYFTATVLFAVLSNTYSEVYIYKVSIKEDLLHSYRNNPNHPFSV